MRAPGPQKKLEPFHAVTNRTYMRHFLPLFFLFATALAAQSEKGIDVVQRANGVFIYRYDETLEKIDPRKDFKAKKQVTEQSVIADLKRLLKDNTDYTPNFKARCMPVWDAGIEFRTATETRMYLFSFRCNTVKSVEDNTFKDFTPQRTELYGLLMYEINDRTSYSGR